MALTSAREKMEFEITPVFPYLTRLSAGGEKVAFTTSAPSATPQGATAEQK